MSEMLDLDWVRAKDDVTELFGKGQVKTPEGKEVFWRLPLRAYLTVLSGVTDPFDFQLVGVHLRSQRGGGEVQRELAADRLGEWLNSDAQLVDADVIIMGDWNEPPDAPAWRSFHDLESAGRARFRSINTKSAISHLYFKNKRSIGSRLDLVALSMAAKDEPFAPVNPRPCSSAAPHDRAFGGPRALREAHHRRRRADTDAAARDTRGGAQTAADAHVRSANRTRARLDARSGGTIESQTMAWVAPKRLGAFDFPPADWELVARLRARPV